MVNWQEVSDENSGWGRLVMSYKAVDLMRHRCREDCLLGPPDGRWEVVVPVRIVDPDKAHTNYWMSAMCSSQRCNCALPEYVLGISLFHFCRTSSVKNSDVFIGA